MGRSTLMSRCSSAATVSRKRHVAREPRWMTTAFQPRPPSSSQGKSGQSSRGTSTNLPALPLLLLSGQMHASSCVSQVIFRPNTWLQKRQCRWGEGGGGTFR